MKIPHFFKAHSRLGIQNLPYKQKSFAIGVEEGPDKILTKDFLSKFPDARVSEFVFSKPETIDKEKYFDVVLKESLKFSQQIFDEVKDGETQIVIGGDHSVTYPSILADLKRHKANIGIIHFDSHADFNLYKDSPSKNFHGMYLRIFFDSFDLPELDATVLNKIPLENLLFVGDLELDWEEIKFFKTHPYSVITHYNTLEQRENTLNKVKTFVQRFDHVHISFDVDVFKESVVSATTTPSRNGFAKDEIFEILKIIKQNAKNFSLDICEVNPRKSGADKAIKIAQEVIKSVV